VTGQPSYFETTRDRAARRWDQLEQDQELAGPWHQLFKQVQSPRHIISELLQNADDAGATEASVKIEGGFFVFEHNGVDFAEDHFASLCRFGYSNKRALHTIGFRGIGFKSTFSLGDQVELFTPTLSVGFHRRRFTEPFWLPHVETQGLTRVRVEISDHCRQREVEKNLEDWIKSPVSLLFFKNLRRMQIGGQAIHWGSVGPGSVPNSEWMALNEQDDQTFLLIRSEAEPFPENALAEIRQERLLDIGDETAFPPCRVEIVLGAKGQLYVVLPTGVQTDLPFACNAPFIQDPARLKIKDPETSPTNRWLLARAGKLAATSMLQWLARADASLVERSSAYDLLPSNASSLEFRSLEGACSTIIKGTFSHEMARQKILLTDSGQLVERKQSVIIPKAVLDIWGPEHAAKLLDEAGRPSFFKDVTAANLAKLLAWDWVDEIDKKALLGILRQKRLPKPNSWRQLLNLWSYIAPEITGWNRSANASDLAICPVQGQDFLFAGNEVVRLGEKKLLQSEDDWEFLSQLLFVMNQNWPRFLAEQRRDSLEQQDRSLKEVVDRAYAVLTEIGLQDTSDVSKVIDQVAAKFFVQKSVSLAGCIQLAQIAAKLGVNTGSSFRFVTRDMKLRTTEKPVLFDGDGTLSTLLPTEISASSLLHADYSRAFKSCSQDDWQNWITSNRTGLQTFIPLTQQRTPVYGKPKIVELARTRGLKEELSYQYVTQQFVVEDWDFEENIWQHWKALAVDDEHFWSKLVERILDQREAYWTKAMTVRILHVATTGSTRAMTSSSLLPAWMLRLRAFACLPDTRGFQRKPDELLRRTPETESLMDVEPFVHGRLDREATRPLLELLGVRCVPSGPDRLLDCLRAMAKSSAPPVHEVEKWYRRLDQMLESCPTGDSQKIRQAFQSEKLIFTEDNCWVLPLAVFLNSNEEDAPGAAVLRSSVKDLALWRKVGVADRPTAELAIEWLKTLPSRKALSQDDARRVRGILARHPMRIWNECEHWVNLAGEWTPVNALSYALTMQSLVAWSHLHLWVKQKTADFQRLPGETTNCPPFSTLPALSVQIEQRLKNAPGSSGQPIQQTWLKTVGAELCRVELDTDDETERVRGLAQALAKTNWVLAPGLEIVPYIGETPAGTARQADVVWQSDALYVDQLPRAKLARRVPEEIGNAFGRADIKAAMHYCFDRSEVNICEYMEENFKLSARVVPQIDPIDDAVVHGANDVDELTHLAVPEDVQHQLPRDEDQDHLSLPVAEDGEPEVSTDDPEEEPSSPDDISVLEPRPRPAPKPAKPSVMERFATAHGFRMNGDDRYVHESGGWIGRTHGARFPWEGRTASGDLLRYYFPKDHCLEREPLQLDADIWGLIDQNPETYALILVNHEGGPVEVTGARLRGMCDDGQVTLYPATYRLVYDHDRHP